MWQSDVPTNFQLSGVDIAAGLEKNLGFLEFCFRFLGFLGFNVHNAEHR